LQKTSSEDALPKIVTSFGSPVSMGWDHHQTAALSALPQKNG
jgi:hypothetical protein